MAQTPNKGWHRRGYFVRHASHWHQAMILQLNPPLPVHSPKGKAWAHMVIDYGQEHDLQWVCFIDATGECWTYGNAAITIQNNITLGREITK